MIVLTAEQEVNQQHSDGRTGDYHNPVAEKEESEHIIHLAKPHVVHDEVELDEDGAEREDSDEEHGREGAEVRG